MAKLDIVKIVNKDSKTGFSFINLKDFDKKKHVLYENKTEKKEVVKPIKKKVTKKSK
jgi:hypothetical protein